VLNINFNTVVSTEWSRNHRTLQCRHMLRCTVKHNGGVWQHSNCMRTPCTPCAMHIQIHKAS